MKSIYCISNFTGLSFIFFAGLSNSRVTPLTELWPDDFTNEPSPEEISSRETGVGPISDRFADNYRALTLLDSPHCVNLEGLIN